MISKFNADDELVFFSVNFISEYYQSSEKLPKHNLLELHLKMDNII